MIKLIASALLSVGIATAAMAANMPKSAAPMAADTGASSAPAKPAATKGKKGHKGKKSTPAPSTTK